MDGGTGVKEGRSDGGEGRMKGWKEGAREGGMDGGTGVKEGGRERVRGGKEWMEGQE